MHQRLKYDSQDFNLTSSISDILKNMKPRQVQVRQDQNSQIGPDSLFPVNRFLKMARIPSTKYNT